MSSSENKVEKINKSLEAIRDLANEGLDSVRKGKPIFDLPAKFIEPHEHLEKSLRDIKKSKT